MSNEHENTIYGSYGEFESYGLPSTDEEWAEYDRQVAEDMAAFDAMAEAGEIPFFPGEDFEPPF